MRRLFPILFLALVQSFQAQAGAALDSQGGRSLAIWSEFLTYKQVETVLPKIKDLHLTLNVAVGGDKPDFDGFAHLSLKAQELGVEVRPWLLLPKSQGYWFSSWNPKDSVAFTQTFLAEMKKRSVLTPWLVFDLESPPEMIDQMQALVDKINLVGLLEFLKQASLKSSLIEAEAQYTSLMKELHDKNIKVEAVAPMQVLNDLGDSEQRIQSAMGVPVSNVPWDSVSFMVYRADLVRAMGKISSRVIYRYAKLAKKYYGSKAAIDLGEAGHVQFPKPFEGFMDPMEIKRDISAAQAAGLTEIHIYSLDGLYESNLNDWFMNYLEPEKPGPDLKSEILFQLVGAGRMLLPKAH